MPFFDDSHVTDVGLEGSAGPVTGAWDFFKQSVEQQFRVDSQQALQEEVRNRWLENLQTFNSQAGTNYEEPFTLNAYTKYMDNIAGEEPGWFDDFDLETKAGVKRLEEADLAIQQAGGKSFSDIVQEVYAMQRETEETTGRMAAQAGTGATIAGFAGAAIGSFSTRDPINVISLPIGGGGRTIATRIASEMAVGGAAVAATDVLAVQPNRARAGLPERSLAFDVAAGAIGAGVIRGGLEGVGAAVRRFRPNGVTIDLDFEDAQLREMLGQADTPRSRAGVAVLDDTIALERANPYGDGPTADARFYAELNEMQKSLGGAPMTAVARVLPPIPIEVVDNALDFKLVKEQSPAVWARLEEAKAKVVGLRTERQALPPRKFQGETLARAEQLPYEEPRIFRTDFEDGSYNLDVAVGKFPDPVMATINVRNGIAEIDIAGTGPGQLGIGNLSRYMKEIQEKYPDIKEFRGDRATGARQELSTDDPRRVQKLNLALRQERRSANLEYKAAYDAVVREADTIRRVEALTRGVQQRDAVDLLGTASAGRPWVGPSMRHDVVEARVAKIAEMEEAIPARADHIAKAVPDGDGMVDIGAGKLVPADMRIPFDDGEMTVQEILDDFVEDDLLDEAMRTCMI